MAEQRQTRTRVASWLAWWVVLMSLWVGRQAGIRYAIRSAWLLRALSLPGQLVSDTALVFGTLAKVVLRKAEPPRGTCREIPVRYGNDTPRGETRRVLLTAARSFPPNAFVVGLDPERDVMLVHELVAKP